MDIEIILEPDLHPNEIAEIAVKAEEYGIRALWSSNYHQNWDAFISLVPAAQKTNIGGKALAGAAMGADNYAGDRRPPAGGRGSTHTDLL